MGVYADWFVGGIACLIGLGFLLSALIGPSPILQLPKMRVLERQVGRTLALAIACLIGVALIALGIAIICGFKWQLL